MRYLNWEARLDQYILSKLDTPFEWGVHDCGSFTTGAIEAMSGMNPAFCMKGKYDSKVGALKFVSRFKLKTFEDLVNHLFADSGMKLVESDEGVMYGDIILADIENMDCNAVGATAGIVDRDGLTMFAGKEGILKSRITEARSVWRL